ncbi:39S ribosomal protein L39, mitochondrial [Athalia rosae]|uniref:39S ribosomal protein L39, mitochondrial n=1 Tax=Athalia rosae TaxID=37344 RepID=UPI002033D296|nr:39S ribosomal protein L39, mitochondrial [Athalia rosae]
MLVYTKMIVSCGNLKLQLPATLRSLSTLSPKIETRRKRNELFDNEKKRQRAAVGRIEKIEVKYLGLTEDVTLVMNKFISTPYNCAQHISESVRNTAALAEVNGVPWDMHSPLVEACDLKLLMTSTPDKQAVNRAFWRTCSLMLGAVAENAFKDDIAVHLHSFPAPNLRSGSFVHDICLGFNDWQPTTAELQSLSALFVQLSQKKIPIERLEVKEDLALEMFQDNPYKSMQIPDIAKNNNSNVVLYRMGEHIEISKGPMVGNTSHIGKCTIASIHKLSTDEIGTLYRFQGVALPAGLLLNHFAYGILEERAKKFNSSIWVPNKITEDTDDHVAAAVN